MVLHKQNQPPLKSLIAFEAVARHSSFTLAAQELNLSQSAISRQIKRLEEILSRPLFLRKPHHVELTPAGKSYLDVIQKLFHELDVNGHLKVHHYGHLKVHHFKSGF